MATVVTFADTPEVTFADLLQDYDHVKEKKNDKFMVINPKEEIKEEKKEIVESESDKPYVHEKIGYTHEEISKMSDDEFQKIMTTKPSKMKVKENSRATEVKSEPEVKQTELMHIRPKPNQILQYPEYKLNDEDQWYWGFDMVSTSKNGGVMHLFRTPRDDEYDDSHEKAWCGLVQMGDCQTIETMSFKPDGETYNQMVDTGRLCNECLGDQVARKQIIEKKASQDIEAEITQVEPQNEVECAKCHAMCPPDTMVKGENIAGRDLWCESCMENPYDLKHGAVQLLTYKGKVYGHGSFSHHSLENIEYNILKLYEIMVKEAKKAISKDHQYKISFDVTDIDDFVRSSYDDEFFMMVDGQIQYINTVLPSYSITDQGKIAIETREQELRRNILDVISKQGHNVVVSELKRVLSKYSKDEIENALSSLVERGVLQLNTTKIIDTKPVRKFGGKTVKYFHSFTNSEHMYESEDGTETVFSSVELESGVEENITGNIMLIVEKSIAQNDEIEDEKHDIVQESELTEDQVIEHDESVANEMEAAEVANVSKNPELTQFKAKLAMDDFKQFIDTVEHLNENITIHVTNDGLEYTQMDRTHIEMIHAKLHNSRFEKYEITKEGKFSLSAKELKGILAKTSTKKKNESVELESLSNGLFIKTAIMGSTISFIQNYNDSMPDLPTIDFTMDVKCTPNDVKEWKIAFKTMEKVSETFMISEKHTDTNLFEKKEFTIKGKSSNARLPCDDLKFSKDVDVTFAIKYVGGFLKKVQPERAMMFQTAKDLPLKIRIVFNEYLPTGQENSFIDYWTAPRVEC